MSHSRKRAYGVAFGPALMVLVSILGSCAQSSSATSSYDGDQGTMILHASSGGITFWLFRNHDDRDGNVCYGFGTGVTPPTEKIDSGGFCLDKYFAVMEADPITASSRQGLQMAVGGALAANVSRVEVIVAGISHEAAIRHGFYFAAMAYGAFLVKAFDAHGSVLAEANRPAPPIGTPTPRLSPPPGLPPSP